MAAARILLHAFLPAAELQPMDELFTAQRIIEDTETSVWSSLQVALGLSSALYRVFLNREKRGLFWSASCFTSFHSGRRLIADLNRSPRGPKLVTISCFKCEFLQTERWFKNNASTDNYPARCICAVNKAGIESPTILSAAFSRLEATGKLSTSGSAPLYTGEETWQILLHCDYLCQRLLRVERSITLPCFYFSRESKN